MPGVERVSAVGSLRRKQDTIGDLNFLVAGKSAPAIFRQFARFGAVQSSEKRGPREQRVQAVIRHPVARISKSPQSLWSETLSDTTGSAGHLADLEQALEMVKSRGYNLALTDDGSRSTRRKFI